MRTRVGLLTIGTSAVKASQVIIAVALVHLLQPRAWSGVALALSIYLAAMTIGSLNLQHSLVFFLPLVDSRQRWQLVWRTARLLFAIGVVIAAALQLLRPVWGSAAGMPGAALALVGGAIALELPTVCAAAVFVTGDRLAQGALWDVTITLVQIAAMVIPAAVGSGVRGVLTGLFVSSAIRLFAFVFVVLHLRRAGTDPVAAGLLRRQLVYCLPLGLSMATSILARSVDKWIVAWVDPSRTGVYAIAAQELPVIAVLPYASGAAVVVQLVRHLSAGEQHEAHRLWRTQASAMSTLVVPITAALVICAPELFALLFPPSYAVGVLPFQLFTLISAHRVTEYGMVLRAANRNRALVRASVVLLVANLIFATIAGTLWGATGVAAGSLAAFTTAWLYILREVASVFGTSWRHAFPWQAWITTALLSAAVAAVSNTIAGPIDQVGIRLAVKAATFTAAIVIVSRLHLVVDRKARVAVSPSGGN